MNILPYILKHRPFSYMPAADIKSKTYEGPLRKHANYLGYPCIFQKTNIKVVDNYTLLFGPIHPVVDTY